jgi:nitric oxide reductase activation protein
MSDGMPNFYIKEDSYKNEDALIHTSKVINKIKKKNIKILSYYVSNSKVENIWKKDFEIMYGKDAKFINVDNINQITQTLNKLFLNKNLIS